MHRLLLIGLTIICVAFNLHGQKRFVNEFLNIGVGARSQGMSNSIVASVNDGTASYWNPSQLSSLNVPFQLNAMHAEWFGGISNYDFFGIAKRVNKEKSSYIGLSVVRLGVDDIPNTINLISADGSINYDRITTFSAADYGIFLSYGTKLTASSPFSIGGSIKVVRRLIGPFANSWGFGGDFSLTYKINENMNFAAIARDITTTFNAWSFNLDDDSKEVFRATNNQIPLSSTETALPRLIVGLNYRNSSGNFNYLAEANIVGSTDGRKSGLIDSESVSIEPSFGLELGYANRVFIRGGIGNIQSAANPENPDKINTDFQPTVGLGLKLGRLAIDYALANVGNVSGVLASHIFSVRLDFNEKSAKQE